jgi:hypothetical protein
VLLISLALATELGANAPLDLKPCPKPTIERQAPRTDPNWSYLTHIRRFKATCGDIGLLSFAEKAGLLEFTPAELDTIADATEAIAEPSEDFAPWSAPLAASAFNDFGGNGGAFGGSYAAVIYVPIPPAPEPEISLLLLFGLGAIAWIRGGRKG